MKIKMGILLSVTFAAFLLGMVVLRVAAYTTEQTKPTLTVTNATGTLVDLHRVTDLERTVNELEEQRNLALEKDTDG